MLSMDGPLISTFNTSLSRLGEIDKELATVDARRTELLQERLALLQDIAQARTVLAHLAAPYVAEAEREQGDQESRTRRTARKRPIRESSTVGWARRVLRTARRPMHIDEILKLIAQMTGRSVSKATLVSNLSRYVKAGDTFRRMAPNTYELIQNETNGGEMRLVG